MSGVDVSPMLRVTDLKVVRGGALVLAVPRLEVQRGETLAIVGPNGAGKSTLLMALALLTRPTHGAISVSGQVATPANALQLRRRMAVVFQEPLLLDASVSENVATGLKLRGASRQERERRVDHALKLFGIAHLARCSARSISGGEAQRVSLARAFALDPEVLFLDEPFSALDEPSRVTLTSDLHAALRRTRSTTVLVTHDRDEALSLADRVAVIIGGELRQIGPPEAVFGAPVDLDVAGFVGVETIVPGVVVANEDGLVSVRVAQSLVEVVSPLVAGAHALLCLRPEDVTLRLSSSPADGAMTSARNQLPGRVRAVQPRRGQCLVIVDCGFPLHAAVTRRSASDMGLRENVPVIASFKASSAHLLPR